MARARMAGDGLWIEEIADLGGDGQAEQFGVGEGGFQEGFSCGGLAEAALDHRPVGAEHHEGDAVAETFEVGDGFVGDEAIGGVEIALSGEN